MATARYYPPEPPAPEPVPPRRQPRKLIRIAAWFWAISTGLLLVLIIVAAILLHSGSFHAYVIRTAEKQAQDALGVRVQLQNYALNLSNLSLDIYGVTVDGASPYSNPPLLQVQHAEAGVRIISILHGKWYLNEIRVDHPIVRVYVDKNGHSNLPTIKSSNNQQSNTSIFDLGIRHALLDNGEVYYNDQPTPLAVDLRNVEFHSVFSDPIKQYSGKLTYTNGQIVYGGFRPFAHNLEAQFDATPTTFHLSPARITSGAAQIDLSAIANNYQTNPSVQATYNVVADGAQLAKLINNPSVPAGVVRASGTAQYRVRTQPAGAADPGAARRPGQPATAGEDLVAGRGDYQSRRALLAGQRQRHAARFSCQRTGRRDHRPGHDEGHQRQLPFRSNRHDPRSVAGPGAGAGRPVCLHRQRRAHRRVERRCESDVGARPSTI